MFSVGFCWEFQMESHAIVGTGMPISLATPIRHSHSKPRNYTPSSFRKCCVQFRHKKAAAPQFRKQQKCSTSVPRRRWRWQPSITESNNLAPQSLEQNKSGSPVPLRAKMCHLSSANKIKSDTPVPLTAKVWQLSSKKYKNAVPRKMLHHGPSVLPSPGLKHTPHERGGKDRRVNP